MMVQVVLCSSSGGKVSNGHVLASDRHIPGKILPWFDPSHSPVAHLEAELVADMCRHVKDTYQVSGTMSIKFQYFTPIWPLTLPCSSFGMRVSNGHVSTLDGHVSRVWDHVHWIPGEILPHFDPWHSPVAHLEAELVMDTCRHVTDTCHVSGTMSIEFLAKFYPILTPGTPL